MPELPDVEGFRRTFARHAAGKTDHEACRICPAMAGSLAGPGDELRLGPLDALSQGRVAKQGQSTGIHGQSLAGIFPPWP